MHIYHSFASTPSECFAIHGSSPFSAAPVPSSLSLLFVLTFHTLSLTWTSVGTCLMVTTTISLLWLIKTKLDLPERWHNRLPNWSLFMSTLNMKVSTCSQVCSLFVILICYFQIHSNDSFCYVGVNYFSRAAIFEFHLLQKGVCFHLYEHCRRSAKHLGKLDDNENIGELIEC